MDKFHVWNFWGRFYSNPRLLILKYILCVIASKYNITFRNSCLLAVTAWVISIETCYMKYNLHQTYSISGPHDVADWTTMVFILG
jgi:hypothetical protein